MSSPPYISAESYLALEEKALEKSDWIDGKIYPRAHSTRDHLSISPALLCLVVAQLRGQTCRCLDSSAKLWIGHAPAFLYADGSVSCPPNFTNRQSGVIDNPKVVFEILSPSTEAYDRGDKFTMYASLPSLEQYVLIDSKRRHVQVWTRIEGGWRFETTIEGTAEIASIGLSLDLDALYEDAVFEDDLTNIVE